MLTHIIFLPWKADHFLLLETLKKKGLYQHETCVQTGILCVMWMVLSHNKLLKTTDSQCCVFIGSSGLSDSDTANWECFEPQRMICLFIVITLTFLPEREKKEKKNDIKKRKKKRILQSEAPYQSTIHSAFYAPKQTNDCQQRSFMMYYTYTSANLIGYILTNETSWGDRAVITGFGGTILCCFKKTKTKKTF